MINVQEATELIRSTIKRNPIVDVRLNDALGNVLAQTIKSREPSPRFDASSVDGYAVSLNAFENFSSDIALPLPVAAEIQAGDNSLRKLSPAKTMRIFTGGRVPAGADAVIMQEYVRRDGSIANFSITPRAEENIRRRGDEFAAKTIIFEPNTLISPAVISTLAALGYEKVKVFKQPRVSVVVSGDEVRAPGEKLLRGEIYDSNSFALKAALDAIGICGAKAYHVRDDLKKTIALLRNVLRNSDMLIVTGGVSVGDHDFIRHALLDLGGEEIFWRVKVKPGKPLLFVRFLKTAASREKYVFGLPGNPVSALVTFHLFVRNAILQNMGFNKDIQTVLATLGGDLKKTAGRAEYIRGKLSFIENSRFVATPFREQESNMTSGLAKADCLIEFPEESAYLAEGTQVKTIPIQWTLF